MFDFIRKLFGSGHLFVSFQTLEGDAGRAKISYTGNPDTFSEERDEFVADFVADVRHKHNKTVIPETICIERISRD